VTPNNNFKVTVKSRICPVVQHQLLMHRLPDITAQTISSHKLELHTFDCFISAFLPRLLHAKSFTMVCKTPGCHIFIPPLSSDSNCSSLPLSMPIRPSLVLAGPLGLVSPPRQANRGAWKYTVSCVCSSRVTVMSPRVLQCTSKEIYRTL
jgi:hypothetical protein